MKLNFGKRLVLFLHWLFSLIVCLYVVVGLFWPQMIQAWAAFFNSLLGAGVAEIAGIALLAVYVLLIVGSVIIIFSGRGKRSERGFITVDSNDAGRTRIAVGAVDQMIRQAVRGVDGITEMKASITNNSDSIAISCNVGIVSGVHVPTVTMNIQRAIRSYIELNCGVAVSAVSVSVHSMADAEGGKGKKKGKAASVSAPAPAAPVPVPVNVPVQEPEIVPEPAPAAEEPAVQEAGQEEEFVLPEIEPITLTLEVPETAATETEEAPVSEE